MPYDEIGYNNFSDSVSDIVSDNNNYDEEILQSSSEELSGTQDTDSSLLLLQSSSDSDIDYSSYLDDIIANQKVIIANQESIIALDTEIQNNSYRLYYFVGGLYVAFAIVIMIKFFKTFLF